MFYSYLYLTLKRALLFVDPAKITLEVHSYLKDLEVEIRGYNDLWRFLRDNEWKNNKVGRNF